MNSVACWNASGRVARWNDSDKATFAKWFGTPSEDARKADLQRIDRMLR